MHAQFLSARFLRSLCTNLALAIVVAACSGGSAGETDDVVIGLPGTIPTPPTPGPGLPPAPAPEPDVEFDEDFIDLGKAGAYPSDLVVDSAGSLYTVDDAQIPATVLRYPSTGGAAATPQVPITAADLIDQDGTRPARAPGVVDYGEGLFGAFTGDLEIVQNRWLFVTVGAGLSVSKPNGIPLRLANLLLVDMVQGRVVQTVNLAWSKADSATFSNGVAYTTIPQSLPSQVAFIPNPDVPGTGKVYVACSNGAGDSNGISLWYHGTVQVWNVDFTGGQPIRPDNTAKVPTDVTRTFVSDHYNPVGLTHFRSAASVDYLILTDAGASRFDANYVAHPETDGVLEFLDLSTERWRPDFEINLGKILPAVQKLALGRDELGRAFAALSSQTYSAAYFVDLSGLDANPVSTPDLRLLRSVDLVEGGAAQVGSGFHPGIGLTASSRTLVLSTFAPAQLTVVGLPGDIEFGAIAVQPSPFDDADLTAETSGGMAGLVVPANNDREVYVLTNGTFDFTTYAPKDPAHIAALQTRTRLP